MMAEGDFAPIAGQPLALADDLALVLAPNPSPMTHLGTNTYVLGTDAVAVIDPGPDNPAHLAALQAVIAGRPVTHILVTHSHLDHSPLAAPLAQATGAPVCAFGDHRAGRSEVMAQLAKDGLVGGGEGIDLGFSPDVRLADGEKVSGPWGTIRAVHTPGHIGNHLCFVWGRRVFTGDHVMGWASSLVSPPDGDLTDFMASCDKLAGIGADLFLSGHGAPITDPAGRLTWLITHRRQREAAILQALETGLRQVSDLTGAIYKDVDPRLLPAAERNVLAHLIDLVGRGQALAKPRLSAFAQFDLDKAGRG